LTYSEELDTILDIGQEHVNEKNTHKGGGNVSEDNIISRVGIPEKVLEEICSIANKCGIIKIQLFGSRARGDFHTTSDIDLAVWGGNIPLFALEVDERTTTLLKYDIVNMDGIVQEDLKASINIEGVTVYEKV